MRFSVVIITWNRKDDLKDSVSSILKQKGVDFELIIVDNGSDDGTESYCLALAEQDKRVRYSRFERNMGITIAENKGLSEAAGDIIFCFDDDQFLEDDDVFIRVNQLAEEREWDILNISVVNAHTQKSGDYHLYAQRRKNNLLMSFYANNFGNGTVFIKRKVIEKIGYFEEFYFRQGHENEFAQRAILNGFNLLYYPELIIQHKCNAYRPGTQEVSYYGLRNSLLKNYKFFSGWRLVLLQMWQLAQFFIFMLCGKISIRLYIKALRDYRNLKKQVQRMLDYNPAAMQKYFFLSRRTATQLQDIGRLNFFQYYIEGFIRFF